MKLLQKIKQLFCSHQRVNTNNPECLKCGKKAICKKHNIPKYLHGYFEELDCIFCQREAKEKKQICPNCGTYCLGKSVFCTPPIIKKVRNR